MYYLIVTISVKLPIYWTHFLVNSNSWFVLCVKKINNHLLLTRRNGSSTFNIAFCMFLWSNCYVIFTVLPETQELYLLAISRWSVPKTRRKKIGKLTFETILIDTKLPNAPRNSDMPVFGNSMFRLPFLVSLIVHVIHFFTVLYRPTQHVPAMPCFYIA